MVRFLVCAISRFQGKGAHVTLSGFLLHVTALKKCPVSIDFSNKGRGFEPLLQKERSDQEGAPDRWLMSEYRRGVYCGYPT